jgi:hypothetical protein
VNIVRVTHMYVDHIFVSNCLLLNLQVVLVFILSIASLVIYFFDASRLVCLKTLFTVIFLAHTMIIQLNLEEAFKKSLSNVHEMK